MPQKDTGKSWIPGRQRRFTSPWLSIAVGAILLAITLPSPGSAGNTDPGCCVCDCRSQPATTSQQQPEPTIVAGQGALCVDTVRQLCGSLCFQAGCQELFAGNECAAVAGCPQAGGGHMAPLASPLVLAAIGAALAGLGIYAVSRPKSHS